MEDALKEFSVAERKTKLKQEAHDQFEGYLYLLKHRVGEKKEYRDQPSAKDRAYVLEEIDKVGQFSIFRDCLYFFVFIICPELYKHGCVHLQALGWLEAQKDAAISTVANRKRMLVDAVTPFIQDYLEITSEIPGDEDVHSEL